jgi:small subunit ribosomal protein S1
MFYRLKHTRAASVRQDPQFAAAHGSRTPEGKRKMAAIKRALIEAERAEKKAQLLAELEVGQRRKGVVKNITAFGAIVDLGGIDGLLHITEMRWGWINHPSEMVAIDQEIEVQILHIDYEEERIALGLKQLAPSPLENVPVTYLVGTQLRGSVINVTSFGAFVKLDEGVEGLVHISEMSWTRRISHPRELVQVGDEIEVVVLKIDNEHHRISLSMKQTQENPWDGVADRYSPGTVVKGTVRHLINYGAFIEIEEGIDGLLHVTNMSWTRMISHPSEMVEVGQVVECRVLSVDQERRHMTLRLVDTSPEVCSTPAARVDDGNAADGTAETGFGSATTTESSGPV